MVVPSCLRGHRRDSGASWTCSCLRGHRRDSGARYELVRGMGSGNFGVARLMRDKHTDELVAVKYIERGDKVCFSSA